MNQPIENILVAAEAFVINFFKEQIDAEYVFHDIQHIRDVLDAIDEIAVGYRLDDHQFELLKLAAWFHDTGYSEGSEAHEQRSCQYARDFLQEQNYPEEDMQVVCGCIYATKVPQEPKNLLEEIICDADMSHLGKDNYWDRCGRIRQELLMTKGMLMTEQDWVDFELDFMNNHHFHTDFANKLYDKRKNKHIRELIKQKLRLNPKKYESVEELAISDKKKKKNKKKRGATKKPKDLAFKELRLGRGVETMYRTAYRTHVNLSAIADNKANIMLSINAIIISIVVSTLVPRCADDPKLIFPTIVLLLVCLVAMIFATLSTRPKVTKGMITREDIAARKSNLLFFGNFYRMQLDDFDWGMKEMIQDSDFLYSSMTRDLYFLGIVLAKKYRLLSYCYTVFMYGIITAVLVFTLFFLF